MKRGIISREMKPVVSVSAGQLVRRFAKFLQTRLAKRSFSWQKRVLVCYCLVVICVKAAVSYRSLVHPATFLIEVAPIKMLPPLPPPVPAPIISYEEYQRIHHWRVQLDSMGVVSQHNKKSTNGPQAWTLRDTLLYLEDLYQQQFK